MSSLSHISYHQRRSLGSRASSPSLSDDEDAITPAAAICPLALPTLESDESSDMTTGQGSRRGSVGSDHFELADWEHLDTAYLWRRMLLLQKKLHCYNSARMTAALEDEHIQAIVPSRACLELLNEGLSKLPDESRRQVSDFLHGRRKTVKGGL